MTDTDATEHPLICNAFSVNGILDGRKTQTRRIVKPQPPHQEDITSYGSGDPVQEVWKYTGLGGKTPRESHVVERPYMPGDVLWVREAFRFPAVNDAISPSEYVGAGCDVWRYEADGEIHDPGEWTEKHDYEWGRKRPSIHMPRELCRIRLRVEDVRVERVRAIRDDDVKAEGIPWPIVWDDLPGSVQQQALDEFSGREPMPRIAFKALWEEIHGDDAWERNDWVWVVLFSLLTDTPATP